MRLANGGTVLWVNPLPLKLPSYKGFIGNKTLYRKIINKIKIHSKLIRKDKNVYVLSILYFPIYENRFFEIINKILLRFQIAVAIRCFLGKEYLVFGSITYMLLDVIDIIKGNKIIFYFADMLSSLRGLSDKVKKTYIQKDKQLIEKSDLILCASKAIMNSLAKINPLTEKFRYCPHGVDFDLFVNPKTQNYKIEEMEKIPKPIIGYFGSLSEANDKEAIRYCAEKKPQWSFVLIGGPLFGDYSLFDNYPNVFLLGKKEYEQIPYYGRYFDVGLLNWRPHDWIKHCFPLKTLEYLALGLPIVATPIDELKLNYAEFVLFATTPEEYLQSIEKYLQENSVEKKRARISAAKNETWDSRVSNLRKWIQQI
jgi:glycosyltransferase involved in cell wall biosynthesis